MPKVRLHRQLARWVIVLALAAPLTPLGIGSPVPALSAAAPLGATVSVLSLPVEIATTEPGALFAPAIDGQTLFEGDTVRTGPGGMALVTFFDGSESQLGGESQVQIEQVRADPAPHIAFLQTAGVTVNHVIPMPAEGSFRTDTPAATGLVRGTSYIVIVGSAGACGTAGGPPCVASMILLTDRNGHVGRVDVTANGSSVAAAVPLSKAGDAAAASNSTATAAHIEPVALAQLESVAHVRSDPTASRTTEQHARAIAATLVPPAAIAPAAPLGGSTAGNPVQPLAETVVVPAPTSDSQPRTSGKRSYAPTLATPRTGEDTDRSNSGQSNSGEAGSTAPAGPSPTTSSASSSSPSPHANSVSPPKVVAPATVATVSHVGSSASGESNSGSNSGSKSATATSPVTPPTPSDPGKPEKPAKLAKASDAGG